MDPSDFFNNIRLLIAKDELGKALQQLQTYLADSPRLDEVIQQAGRFVAIRKQLDLGVVSRENAELNTNQVRMGVLELLKEIEHSTDQPDLKVEAEKAADQVDKTIIQNAEKIYNIDNIDNANFS